MEETDGRRLCRFVYLIARSGGRVRKADVILPAPLSYFSRCLLVCSAVILRPAKISPSFAAEHLASWLAMMTNIAGWPAG